jgi:hypothetical protein
MSKQDIEKRLGFAAQGVKETTRTSAKAEMGFLSRVGYAATALTADPADPKSAEYRKQVAEAKAAAKDAITNYKFMRDKVKERLAALDAYVTNAIKVINTATSAKDIEHYVEQLRIAVKSQSMILGASKSPFSRSGAKADFAAMGPAPLRGSPARKAEIAEEKAAAVARAAARDEEKATIQRKLNTLRPRYRELADYLKAATPRIYNLNRQTWRTPDMKKKAKLVKLLDKEFAVAKETEIAFKQTSKEISELEKRARKLGMTLQASRPGAKAKFADAALNQIRNNAAISDKIRTLVSKGLSVPQAIDSVLGEGTYKRIGSEVYDELKKAKSSRPGTKAKMSATFIVSEAIFNAENAVRRGDTENARRWIKAAQDAMDETVVSTGMRSKLEQLVKRYKMSRPGVKAKA